MPQRKSKSSKKKGTKMSDAEVLVLKAQSQVCWSGYMVVVCYVLFSFHRRIPLMHLLPFNPSIEMGYSLNSSASRLQPWISPWLIGLLISWKETCKRCNLIAPIFLTLFKPASLGMRKVNGGGTRAKSLEKWQKIQQLI